MRQLTLLDAGVPGLDAKGTTVLAMLDGATARASAHDALTVDERGAVFTRPEVVDFILDLVGYTPAADLTKRRILEPSCGHGEFLLAIVDRLLASCQRHHGGLADAGTLLADAVCAVEAHLPSAQATLARVVERLHAGGIPTAVAKRLAGVWIRHGDSLLIDLPEPFDAIVGNPPYVRQELIPDDLLATYRRRYTTLYNRADLYVPFFERGLRMLAPKGHLCFICSDRWMKCAYGRPLRALVASEYHLDVFVDMVDTPAFQSEVIAYPAITMLSHRNGYTGTRAAYRPTIEAKHLHRLATELRSGTNGADLGIMDLTGVAEGDQPWLLEGGPRLALVKRLEERFPALEDAGCKVGIGVATGSDRIYVRPKDGLDIEPERLLPLVMADDIDSGRIAWGGSVLVNPFETDGSLVELRRYPRLARYLRQHEEALRARNVAKRSGEGWYRTIDRVWHHLTATPKLLIPDIKGEANVVLDEGRYYPHHNLYWVTAQDWDLRALQAILRSTIAKLFVATYCVKMAGGFLRFQAQYIRRIRVPTWASIPAAQRRELIAAASALDQELIDHAASAVYGLTPKDVRVIEAFRRDPAAR